MRTNWQYLDTVIGDHSKVIHEWDLIKGFVGIAATGFKVLDGTVNWVREDTGNAVEM